MPSLTRANSMTDYFRSRPLARPRSPSRHVRTPTVSPSTSPNLATPTASRPGDPFQSTSAYSSDPQQQSRSPSGIQRSDTNDSGLDDILGAYGDSPTKTRNHVPTPPSASPVRQHNPFVPPRGESMKRTQTDQSTASSSSAFDVLPTLDRRNDSSALGRSTGSNGVGSKAERPGHPSRSKSGNSLDLIDRLDISGLYGGGGFVRHDGPYAAASTTRNQGTRAPIDAFDPSAFSLAPPKPARQHSSIVSPRAAATLAAMDAEGFSNDGPYGAASGNSGSSRRNGEHGGGDVSMGFPSKKASGKGQQLIEIYGVRDSEAWEDFGSTRYEPESGAASRESVVPPGVNKEDRMQRAQSIWDIEATLRAGKPVGQTAAPPPVPVMPSEWSQSSLSDSSPNLDNKPKRSKSLAARFRAGRKNPNNPILDEVNDSEGREAGLAYSQTNGSRSQPTSPVEDRRMQYPPTSSITQVQGQAISTPMGGLHPSHSHSQSPVLGSSQIKFDESAALEKRPSGATRFADQEDKKEEGLGRRPSGLKRLFSKKGKSLLTPVMTSTVSSTLPPPESPFTPRPSAPTSTETTATPPPSDASTPTGPISAKPLPVEFPLTSFASTPHNVACIAFLLGGVWSIGIYLFLSNLLSFSSTTGWYVWSNKFTQVELPSQGWSTSFKSPQLGFYLASWSFFHLMEFVVTSMYNPGKLSVSSYLLDNGREYIAAHIAGVVEYILEETFLPARYRGYKHFGGTTLLGFALVAAGQTLRSFAMISASSNFSHFKLPSHQLVTSGIYSWSRHPSYAGFYWWALGTQIALGNPICSIVFMATLQWFFSIRIRVEEKYLVKFFGQAYKDYRSKVPSRIIFVR
ncbi:hypothetical protein JCM16303_007030 [Sporobolomyces ruberrimus]